MVRRTRSQLYRPTSICLADGYAYTQCSRPPALHSLNLFALKTRPFLRFFELRLIRSIPFLVACPFLAFVSCGSIHFLLLLRVRYIQSV